MQRYGSALVGTLNPQAGLNSKSGWLGPNIPPQFGITNSVSNSFLEDYYHHLFPLAANFYSISLMQYLTYKPETLFCIFAIRKQMLHSWNWFCRAENRSSSSLPGAICLRVCTRGQYWHPGFVNYRFLWQNLDIASKWNEVTRYVDLPPKKNLINLSDSLWLMMSCWFCEILFACYSRKGSELMRSSI